jgi:hypothetical protein
MEYWNTSELIGSDKQSTDKHRSPFRNGNKLRSEDRAAHEWYRFVLSFPPHLVREYIRRFGLRESHTVLDPFCGTGTTLVECRKLGIPSVGIERHPMPCFASKVKVDWTVDPDGLIRHATRVARVAAHRLLQQGFEPEALPLFRNRERSDFKSLTLPAEASKLLLRNSISPRPLHRTLVLLETLREHADSRFDDHERLALAKAIVSGVSNLHFGPEVGVGPPKHDAPAVEIWLENVRTMAKDVRELPQNKDPQTIVHQVDSRHLSDVLAPESIDAVITSPPYPNEKDYTRTTRLESVLLGFIRNKEDLRSIKQSLVRSNTRSVYKTDEDDLLVAGHDEIQRICNAIETRRLELGKTSGFERLYSRVARLYFGGMVRHLASLRAVLRPDAQLAYVVGDQASYLRVMIRTGRLLADIAEKLGYEVLGIDLFRTRLATATREQLREEVVVLRWKGAHRDK